MGNVGIRITQETRTVIHGLSALAKATGYSKAHLHYVLIGERPAGKRLRPLLEAHNIKLPRSFGRVQHAN